MRLVLRLLKVPGLSYIATSLPRRISGLSLMLDLAVMERIVPITCVGLSWKEVFQQRLDQIITLILK